jgi:hypothetical protein
VTAEITAICHDPWIRRILTWTLTGEHPADLRLSWTVDEDARQRLEDDIFGKRVLVTNRDTWPVAELVAAYRSQSDAEFGFRQLKDPHAVSFSPMNHWTDQAIRVHTYTCVLALQLAHLIRREAAQAGLSMSVRALIEALAGIQETVLIYPATGGWITCTKATSCSVPTSQAPASGSSTSRPAARSPPVLGRSRNPGPRGPVPATPPGAR